MSTTWCMYHNCPDSAAAEEDNQGHPMSKSHNGAVKTVTS